MKTRKKGTMRRGFAAMNLLTALPLLSVLLAATCVAQDAITAQSIEARSYAVPSAAAQEKRPAMTTESVGRAYEPLKAGDAEPSFGGTGVLTLNPGFGQSRSSSAFA